MAGEGYRQQFAAPVGASTVAKHIASVFGEPQISAAPTSQRSEPPASAGGAGPAEPAPAPPADTAWPFVPRTAGASAAVTGSVAGGCRETVPELRGGFRSVRA